MKNISLLALIIASINISAQIFEPETHRHHLIYLNCGYDYNLISQNIGYGFYFPKIKSSAFADITQGTALIGTGNFRTQIGMQSWTGLEGRLLIKSSLAFVLSRSINKAGNYNGLGLNLNLNLGYVLNRSGIGIDIQYNPFLSTHIKHSEYWREYYYANAKDGWYSSTANNLRIGAFHCQKLDNQKTWEINLRGGYQTSGKFDHLIPGFYFIIGINKTV